jgi:hypothetical protein
MSMMGWRVGALLGVAVLTHAAGADRNQNPSKPKPDASALVRSVSLRAVGPADQGRGDVLVESGDGKVSALTHDGMATQPKLARDSRTVGFVVVAWTMYHDEKTLSYPKVVIYRDGKPLRSIGPEKIAGVDWGFRDAGRQIAVASSGMHGMTFFQLFDVVSGALLDSTNSANTELPPWTEGLLSR